MNPFSGIFQTQNQVSGPEILGVVSPSEYAEGAGNKTDVQRRGGGQLALEEQ